MHSFASSPAPLPDLLCSVVKSCACSCVEANDRKLTGATRPAGQQRTGSCTRNSIRLPCQFASTLNDDDEEDYASVFSVWPVLPPIHNLYRGCAF